MRLQRSQLLSPLLLESKKKKVRSIHLFDMDGTLLLSPEKRWAEHLYNKHHPTGGTWEGDHGKKWWSVPQSLSGHRHKPFPIKPIPDTVRHYHAAKASPNSRVIVMTGRINTPKMQTAVSGALDRGGIPGHKHGHDLFLKPQPKPGKPTPKTHIWKGEMLRRFVKQHPHLRRMHIHDDRPDHLEHFGKVLHGLGIRHTLNHVQHPDWGANMPDTT